MPGVINTALKLTLVPRDEWIDARVSELVNNGESRRHASIQAIDEKRMGKERITQWKMFRGKWRELD